MVETGWDAYSRQRGRPDAFRDALTAQTPVPYVTLGVVLLNVVVFVLMLVGDGPLSEADTLVRWGGSSAPWTTNGEWWRLVTATFVHTGFVQLFVEMAVLSQAGILVERMLGHVAFAAAYVASAAFAAALGLLADPLPVSVGASGAILGLQGLVIAIIFARHPAAFAGDHPDARHRQTCAGGGDLRHLHLGGRWPTVDLRPRGVRHPVRHRTGAHQERGGAEALRAPHRRSGCDRARDRDGHRGAPGGDDGRASGDRATDRGRGSNDGVVSDRDRAVQTGRDPEGGAGEFDRGRHRPGTQRSRAPAQRRRGRPRQQQPLVESAGDFLQLRRESWLLRARALRQASMSKLRDADEVERASLDLLRQLKPSL